MLAFNTYDENFQFFFLNPDMQGKQYNLTGS